MFPDPIQVRSPLLPGEGLVAGTWVARPQWRTVRAHGSPDWQLLSTVPGEGRLRHAGGDTRLGTREVVVIPAGVPHTVMIAAQCRRWEVAWVQFALQPAWRERLTGLVAPGCILVVALPAEQDQQQLLDVLAAMLLLQARPGPFHGPLLASQLELLILQVARLQAERDQDPRIRRVLDLLAREDRVPTSREILAHATALSPARLSTLFQRAVGVSLPAYRERLRMRRAMALLASSDAPVSEISQLLGYSDPRYFSGRFRRATGLPPGRWRATAGDLAAQPPATAPGPSPVR